MARTGGLIYFVGSGGCHEQNCSDSDSARKPAPLREPVWRWREADIPSIYPGLPNQAVAAWIPAQKR